MARRIRLRIRYERRSDLVTLLVLALLTATFLGYLAWGQGKAVASTREQSQAMYHPLRRYYLSTTIHDGAGAASACATGYHMASLWELLDPSHLKYITDLGVIRDDSGQGPPAHSGWVRTGNVSGVTGTPGLGNCQAWTSNLAGDVGSFAFLPNTWTAGQEDIGVWAVGGAICSVRTYVWCIADEAGFTLYLPLLLRNYS